MGLRIFDDNFIDAAGVAITAKSESARLPATNVAESALNNPWRTGASVADEWLKFNLGSAQSATAILMYNMDGWSGYTAIETEYNSSDSWGAASSAFMLTLAAQPNMVYSLPNPALNYQWFRFIFTKPTAGTATDLSRSFIGTYTDIAEEVDWNQLKFPTKELTRTSQTVGGARFSDIRPQYRDIQARLSSISQTSLDSLQSIFTAKGTHTPFWMQIDPTGSNIVNEYLYVRFKKDFKPAIGGYDGGHLYDITLDFIEEAA